MGEIRVQENVPQENKLGLQLIIWPKNMATVTRKRITEVLNSHPKHKKVNTGSGGQEFKVKMKLNIEKYY